jgi:hypothetical protein
VLHEDAASVPFDLAHPPRSAVQAAGQHDGDQRGPERTGRGHEKLVGESVARTIALPEHRQALLGRDDELPIVRRHVHGPRLKPLALTGGGSRQGAAAA